MDNEPGDLIALIILIGLVGAAAAGSRSLSSGGFDGHAWVEHWQGECFVQEIVDGDQVLCNDSTRVRLIGVDAPELSYPEVGADARAALASIVRPNALLRVTLDEVATDTNDRVHVYMYLRDGRMVNALMAEAGYAIAKEQPPNLRHQALIALKSSEARREERGLWPHPTFLCFASGLPSSECSGPPGPQVIRE